MNNAPLLETHGLSKVYSGIEPVYALRDISLRIETGEFLSIIGPSGSGKSTLMNVLGLLDSATGGEMRYLGEPISRWDEARKSQFRNAEIGFIFQAHMLLPEFNALENILMPVRIAGMYGSPYGPAEVEKAKGLLARIGLGDRMHHRPGELSGGQNQRVAIARALMNTPKIVFADEPTGALDHQTSHEVYELMREINAEDRVTFVIVTHERELSRKTDRILSLLDGRVQSDEWRQTPGKVS